MVSSALRRAVGVLLLTAAILNVSGVWIIPFSLDGGTSYNFSNSNDGRQPECLVCVKEGRKQTCQASVLLQGPASVIVDFHCSKLQDVIHLEVRRNIECTKQSCNGNITMEERSGLLGFNRTYVWTLMAAAPKAFLIDFTGTGLRQIHPSQACPDKNTYTLQAVGRVAIGRYCKDGPISQAQVLNQGSFAVHVPAGEPLRAGPFHVSVGEEIKSLAKIKVVLPTGTSSSPVDLLSPNYPQSFPDDDLVQWEIQLPGRHSAAVQVVNHTEPACRKKGTAGVYGEGGRGMLLLGRSDSRPAREKHNFTMTLKNCEMGRTRRSPRGLSLHLRVTATPTGKPVLCSVDLRTGQGLSLKLTKIRPDSECLMTMNSVAAGTMLVPSYGVAQLSFQDCSPADVWVTANRVIGPSLEAHFRKPFPLEVPSLPPCLPAPLRSVTWSLVHPARGSTEVLGPGDGLQRSLPGRPCNGSLTLAVAEDGGGGGGTPLGTFCPGGPIQSIQFRSNVSVTASVDQASRRGVQPSTRHSRLGAHFKEEITEDYIFTLAPKGSEPTLLASPGWPKGMQSYSSISWIVRVPAKQEAHLVFVNLSQPKCSNRHTSIRIRLLDSAEEMYSRREDEEAEEQVDVPGSFYLNISNCMMESGEFSMLTEMTLGKSRNFLLTVIASVVSVLLVIAAVVLAVVCVVIRKKKKELNRNQVSVYNPAGAIFRPGVSNLPGEDEYHVYASIEDTMVYTHLLKKELSMEGDADVETYRPFTGPTEPQRPPSAINPAVDTYRPFMGTPHIGPPVPRANRASRDLCAAQDDLHAPDGQSDLGAPEEPASERPALGNRMEPEGQ
ncbi:CUB domain-containing protein 1-like [Gadus macrocephalus]|uniref:CUB domain-containing protein 1-like n=1 Tax=Gadus macrocephalus TaxID=80720 RepID=UPI0028CB54B2|nr:CUB domain-containing protein 1-like [Gadus macrocephalus]